MISIFGRRKNEKMKKRRETKMHPRMKNLMLVAVAAAHALKPDTMVNTPATYTRTHTSAQTCSLREQSDQKVIDIKI